MSLLRRGGAVAALLSAATVLLAPTPAVADRIRDQQWYLRALNVAAAHRISQGEGVVVAVLDTGVEPHPDLQRNLLSGTDTVPGGSGDGRQTHNPHGTAMAGLIAAHGKSAGMGVLGIAPRSKILPVRDVTPTDRGGAAIVAKGIHWAISHRAKVVNISSSTDFSPVLVEAVKAAQAADIVVVAAGGNRPEDFGAIYPASIEGVVAVSGTNRTGTRGGFSVPSPKITIAAPGEDIFGLGVKGAYSKGSGTSSSAAIVSGAAALVRSKYPQLSAKEVIHRLTATATDKGKPGRDDEYGYGELNLVAALTANVPPLADATPTAAATATQPTPSTSVAGTQTQQPNTTKGVVVVAAVAGGALLVLIPTLLIRRRRRSGGPGTVTRGWS